MTLLLDPTLSLSDADVNELVAGVCRESFEYFVREFWDVVPGAAPLQWNWHMSVLCQELQSIAERVFPNRCVNGRLVPKDVEPRTHDVCVNISPGTSKSTICSILFHPWTWTRYPQARHLSASHTAELVLDLAYKAREVIRSEKYRQLFPDIELKEDRDAVGLFRNDHGGDRMSCTVAGKSPMGFHAHFICFPGETLIQTEMGDLPIGRLVDEKVPVRVLGYDHEAGCPVWAKVVGYGSTPGRPVCLVRFADGSSLEATDNHPVYVVGKGYVPAGDLSCGDEVIRAVPVQELWGDGLQATESCGPGGNRMGVLFPRLSGCLHERREQFSLLQREAEVSGLWQDDRGGKGSFGHEPLLQLCLQGKGCSGGEPSSSCQTSPGRLWELRQEVDCTAPSAVVEGKLLFSGLCRSSPCKEDGGTGKQQLHSRDGFWGVPTRVCQGQNDGAEEGRGLLPFVWQDAKGERQATGCPPRRLGQGEQRHGELGSLVSLLPPRNAGGCGQTPSLRSTFVESVEHQVRLPDTVYNLEVEGVHNYFAGGVLVHNCIDDPIDPKKAVSEAELRDARRFMTDVIPSRMVDKSVTPTFLVMQRLHREDPTAVMLEIARSEDTTPVRHFCFPGELYNSWPVYPEEFKARYVDDLMDPVRLPRNVLKGYQARGAYGYAGQYGQQPVPVGGGMFKEDWYNQRILAAPYNGRRVRFWDRASTADGGCYSAGVLMSRGPDQNYYVEHVVHGQWEPDERNRRIRSTALQDRSRYGPSHEPEIVIEDEGGSTGKDANKGLARVLEGFHVTFQKVTGSKDTRAEPWATQLSAGNVFIVEDGTWDVWGYVNEHTSFKPEPGKRLGRYKDQVDASSGAFNRLAGAADTSGIFRVLGARKGQKGLRIVCCSREALANTVIDDHRCLLVLIEDPLVPGVPLSDVEPLHGLSKLLDTLTIVFPDLDPKDYQGCWQEPVHPWGKTPDQLVMSPQDGKKFWSFFLRKRDPAPEVLVIVDHGDRRALSAACGVCEVQRIPQKDAVYRVGVVNNESWDGSAPNPHVCGIVRTSRHLVL